MGPSTDRVIRWLLDGDPAICWQTLRDPVGAAQRTVERERGRIARDGWGARLLARQDAEGTWAGGLYSPKWISTTYTMLMLRDFGLSAENRQARRACALLLEGGDPAQRRNQLRMAGTKRDMRHRDGVVHPVVLQV